MLSIVFHLFSVYCNDRSTIISGNWTLGSLEAAILAGHLKKYDLVQSVIFQVVLDNGMGSELKVEYCKYRNTPIEKERWGWYVPFFCDLAPIVSIFLSAQPADKG